MKTNFRPIDINDIESLLTAATGLAERGTDEGYPFKALKRARLSEAHRNRFAAIVLRAEARRQEKREACAAFRASIGAPERATRKGFLGKSIF